jgi:hypothetical protein
MPPRREFEKLTKSMTIQAIRRGGLYMVESRDEEGLPRHRQESKYRLLPEARDAAVFHAAAAEFKTWELSSR